MMLLKVLERLDAKFSPHVISLNTLGEIGPRIQALGIPVEALGMQSGVPNPLAFFRLVRRLKKLKPDAVHTWCYHADLFGGLAARLAGVPAIGWGIRHGNLSPLSNKHSTLTVVRACAFLSRWVPLRILCCSQVAMQVHVDVGYVADKMVVVPNGFDLACFKPDEVARSSVRAELGVEDDILLVGMIGRFKPQKNYGGFVEAAGLLHQRMPEVHFLMAGSGVDATNAGLVSDIQQVDVEGVMHLIGERNDIPRLMAALDVLASSSIGEAFPNVLGEAMASGVPCAVTDVGDSAYIVGDAGRVVMPGDMSGLASALEELFTLPHAARRALGKRARARVEEHFEIGKVVRQYEAFYQDLVENPVDGISFDERGS